MDYLGVVKMSEEIVLEEGMTFYHNRTEYLLLKWGDSWHIADNTRGKRDFIATTEELTRWLKANNLKPKTPSKSVKLNHSTSN